ncbi:hypothetical protein [Vulcanisaeta souniana]|uniref:hypothetical protein n=1 Tax=Vulcanisaeta souniana TaxID=164452 RepID=UPI000B0553D0|nr:hypothetical protein [Vulcanisaeta souniana]
MYGGLINATYTDWRVALTVTGTNISNVINITPPSITITNYVWNVNRTDIYVNVTLSVSGPYSYLVLGRVVTNSSIESMYTLSPNDTSVTINTGFSAFTIQRPKLIMNLSSPWLVIYPQPIKITLNITAPQHLAYAGNISIYINNTLYNQTSVDLQPGESITINAELSPDEPGLLNITILPRIFSQ